MRGDMFAHYGKTEDEMEKLKNLFPDRVQLL